MSKQRRDRLAKALTLALLANLTMSGCRSGITRHPSPRLVALPAAFVQQDHDRAAAAATANPEVTETSASQQPHVQLVQHTLTPADYPAITLASLPLDRQKNTDPRDDQAGSSNSASLEAKQTVNGGEQTNKVVDKDTAKSSSVEAAPKPSKDDKQTGTALAAPTIQLAAPATFGTYTLDQLMALARANSPAIREAEAAVAKVEGLRYQVGLRPNPTVGYNGTQLADQNTDQHTVFVNQDFITAQKLERNTGVLGLEVENLKWQAETQRRSVAGDVKQLFFETLGAQQKLELSNKFVDMAEKAVEISRLRKKAGEGTEVDVLQSEVQLQQIAVSNRQQAAALVGGWTRLAAVVGQADMPLGLIDGQLPTEIHSYDWEAEYVRLCAESPELMAAQTRVARARANIDRQRVQATPNLSWMVAAGYDRGTDSQLINTQVGIPLRSIIKTRAMSRLRRPTIAALCKKFSVYNFPSSRDWRQQLRPTSPLPLRLSFTRRPSSPRPRKCLSWLN